LVNAISCIINSLIDEIKVHYVNYDVLRVPYESLDKEARTSEEIEKFTSYELKDHVLYYNSSICIPNFGEYRLNIMHDCHDIPIAGHSGFQKTYMAIKRHYYWQGMKSGIKNYVERCLKCQVLKIEQVKNPGLLQPLGVPNLKFESKVWTLLLVFLKLKLDLIVSLLLLID
jgi:hypothetical protein